MSGETDFSALQLRVRVTRLLDAPANLLQIVPDKTNLSLWLGQSLQIVGWGVAKLLEFPGRHQITGAAHAWQEICRQARVSGETEQAEGLPQLPIALGSFGFAHHTPGFLVIPAFAFVQTNGETWLVSTAVNAEPPSPSEAIFTDILPLEVPTGLWTEPGSMTQSKWKSSVRRLSEILRAGAASKVVLTRDIKVSAANAIDERFLARQLADRYPTTWTYAVKGLIGASPEILAVMKNRQVVSRVLAGTSEPGHDQELLESAKDRSEHRLAVESVARALVPLADEIEVPPAPELLQLPNVVHLATRVQARVKTDNILEVVDALHPTAAVCGTPTHLAFELLKDFETTKRGRYCGPVGWIDAAGEGEFAIALRCGQLSEDHKHISVYAGGGIMPDSLPEVELAETRAKMRPVLQALGLDNV